jgi:eukaryotic-like serine/threonine-protein kinase
VQQIGRYEILEEIGRGAMGVVFKGRDPLIGRAVAVKTITSGVAESVDLLERFYREARAAGGLQHPNIVTIYEMAESGGSPFIAMEYLEGESLEKLVARKAALPLSTKVSYVIQTCHALDFAHRRGVIHRDIKPANIVVTGDGVVKVVDFGIARIADTSKTQTGAMLGTLAYMPPEQLRGQHADAQGDIWALGVVLYELLGYERPFTGENHAAVLLSILQNEPAPIRQVVPECPAALENIVSRALRKDHMERYPTMAAFLKDLEKIAPSLDREASPAAVAKAIPLPKAQQAPAATQRIDVQELNDVDKIRASKPNAPAARSIAQQQSPVPAAPRASNGSPTSKPNARPKADAPQAQAQNRSTPAAKTRSRIKAAAIYATLAAALLVAVGVVRHRKIVAAAVDPEIKLTVTTPSPPLPATPASAPAPTPASTSGSVPVAESSSPSLEDQQHHLIDLAHEAADKHDYKSAQTNLTAAAKLNGPLSGLVADLQRQFGEQAYGAELERAAREEQTLWEQSMADLQDGRFDRAEKALRDLLLLPEAGRHWADAERYVDQVIPERRQEQQLWAETQMEASSNERGHLLKEIKALDEVMAEGGTHEQQARQRRNVVIRQMVRENARRNGLVDPTLSEGYEAQLAELETQFGNLALKGDAAALEGLQELRPKFKALADAGGPLAMDARDYLNSVIPKAQKQIEDNLAADAADLSANADYEHAVKDYDRAVATQNTSMLRGRVLSAFQRIAQSGGIRAKEAEWYVNVLIPSALKKSGS